LLPICIPFWGAGRATSGATKHHEATPSRREARVL
jgi:hypothetical protein